MSKLTFANIGLQDHSTGQVTLKDDRIEWRDRSNQNVKEVMKENIASLSWSIYGNKAYLKVNLDDGQSVKFDGFGKIDYNTISKYANDVYKLDISNISNASDGCNYGNVVFEGKSINMMSISDKPIFDLKLESLNSCVVPEKSKDEMELQFKDVDNQGDCDCLAQITFHFPYNGADDDLDEYIDEENEDFDNYEKERSSLTQAEKLKQTIIESGLLKSATDKIIVEFTKEQGNFVTPRGKFIMQMTSSHLHMQGNQYFYKIKYDDINSLFLLPKLDGRMAFVIALDKPIRQGNQKYQHLVIDTNKLEGTMKVNLTVEECQSQYDNALSPEITAPMSTLIAKIFKVLSQTTVYVPKHFVSSREANCVRCNLKANDGLLYPLAKSFIFIHKPTVIIKFDDVESIEFKRYEDTMNSATRNFDLSVVVKATAASISDSKEKEFLFTAIDRSEYGFLYDFLEMKQLNLLNKKVTERKKSEAIAELLGDDDDGDEDEEDDDYDGANSSGSDDDNSDDSDDDDSNDSNDGDNDKKRKKGKHSSSKQSSSKSVKEPRVAKKAKKDPDAPKAAKSSYMFYSQDKAKSLKIDNPTLKQSEVFKIVGDAWMALSADEKVTYEEKAAKDKSRYQREMSSYVPPIGTSSGSGSGKSKAAAGGAGGKRKAPKDSNAPKKNMSSYFFFTAANRDRVKKDNPGLSVTEMSREFGLQWNALSKDDKTVYEEQAAADKTRYQRESDEYRKRKKSEILTGNSDDGSDDDSNDGAEGDDGSDDNDNGDSDNNNDDDDDE